ncbi:hypothetical protein BB560_000324 [Smittium megazygosporum]|uniref:Uncharacterized protein n=1 Tax=Smittium megazygosporum TaxID=133381 RepID=A0A2T9ZKP0_9FUNG|nr:hypothetical protein BB560_000324 [Smittium megazygosporum]
MKLSSTLTIFPLFLASLSNATSLGINKSKKFRTDITTATKGNLLFNRGSLVYTTNICPDNGYVYNDTSGYSYNSYRLIDGGICIFSDDSYSGTTTCYSIDNSVTTFIDYPTNYPYGASGMIRRICTIDRYSYSPGVSCVNDPNGECEPIGPVNPCKSKDKNVIMYVDGNKLCKCTNPGVSEYSDCQQPINTDTSSTSSTTTTTTSSSKYPTTTSSTTTTTSSSKYPTTTTSTTTTTSSSIYPTSTSTTTTTTSSSIYPTTTTTTTTTTTSTSPTNTLSCSTSGYSYNSYRLIDGGICIVSDDSYSGTTTCYSIDNSVTTFIDYPTNYPYGASGMIRRICTIDRYSYSPGVSCVNDPNGECEPIGPVNPCKSKDKNVIMYVDGNKLCKCTNPGYE